MRIIWEKRSNAKKNIGGVETSKYVIIFKDFIPNNCFFNEFRNSRLLIHIKVAYRSRNKTTNYAVRDQQINMTVHGALLIFNNNP